MIGVCHIGKMLCGPHLVLLLLLLLLVQPGFGQVAKTYKCYECVSTAKEIDTCSTLTFDPKNTWKSMGCTACMVAVESIDGRTVTTRSCTFNNDCQPGELNTCCQRDLCNGADASARLTSGGATLHVTCKRHAIGLAVMAALICGSMFHPQ